MTVAAVEDEVRALRKRVAGMKLQNEIPRKAAAYFAKDERHDDPLTDLFELIMGTGMRRGEALAPHWADVHLDERILLVRYTLSNIDNTTPVFTTPKPRSRLAWVCLSDRVAHAFQRQARRQPAAISSSLGAVDNPCALNRCCGASTASATRRACRESAPTIYDTSPRPRCSAPTCRCRWPARRCATPRCR
nr:hypothetical protein [Actinokineospora xionganensis]